MKKICIGSMCMGDILSALPALIYLSKSEPVNLTISNFSGLIKKILSNNYNIQVSSGIDNPIDSEIFTYKNVATRCMVDIWFDHFFGHHAFDRTLPLYTSTKPKINCVALHTTYRLKCQSIDYKIWKHIIDHINSLGLDVVFIGRAFGHMYDVDTLFLPNVNKFTIEESLDIISRCKLLITPMDGFCVLGGCTSTNILTLATRMNPDSFLPMRSKGIILPVETLMDCKYCTTKMGLGQVDIFDQNCDKNYKCIGMFDLDRITEAINTLSK